MIEHVQGGMAVRECPLWVKSGLFSQRHFMSALPPIADIERDNNLEFNQSRSLSSVGQLFLFAGKASNNSRRRKPFSNALTVARLRANFSEASSLPKASAISLA